MKRLCCLIFLMAIADASAAGGQKRPYEPELRTLVNERHRAVEFYRAGRTVEAVEQLANSPHWLNRLIADRIIQWTHDPQPQMKDAKGLPLKTWSAQSVVSLASLHREGALHVHAARGNVAD